MTTPGWLHCDPSSPALPVAVGLSWLWRLGVVQPEPGRGLIGLGTRDESDRLEGLTRAGRLAGAVILVGDPTGEDGRTPEQRLVSGRARFPDGIVEGTFTVLDGGAAALRSGLGNHAVTVGDLLYAGVSPASWGRVDSYWMFPLLARYFVDALGRPLEVLPKIGCLRLDDFPGTAQHQLEQRAHDDGEMARRIARVARAYERADARLVVAVASCALVDGRSVPLETVWPESVVAMARAVTDGMFEPACHGTLHLDTDALAEGTIEPREFARLDADEAGRRLDSAIEWMTRTLGQPTSFVAPAWGYSRGALDAAAARGLPAWLPPEAAPLLEGCAVHETLGESLRGIVRLDYRFLATLAEVGLPPTVVLHGGLLDHRLSTLRLPRDAATLARLYRRRDLVRLPQVASVRWVGAAEFVAALRAHGGAEPGAANAPAARLFGG